MPDLGDLAGGHQTSIKPLQEACESPEAQPGPRKAWMGRLCEELSQARWLSGEMLARARTLREEIRALSQGIDLGFLYDRERRLFSIGYHVSQDRPDTSYYDLLASEARLASFIAVARGDAPVEHWLALARPYGSAGGRRVLLSWSGTMFEYLMPLLLMRAYPNSLLDQACREALEAADRLRPPAGRPLGHLGVGLRGPGRPADLPVPGLRRPRPRPEARPGGRPGGRALRHAAGPGGESRRGGAQPRSPVLAWVSGGNTGCTRPSTSPGRDGTKGARRSSSRPSWPTTRGWACWPSTTSSTTGS